MICASSSVMTMRCDTAFRPRTQRRVVGRANRHRCRQFGVWESFLAPKVALRAVNGVSENKKCPMVSAETQGLKLGYLDSNPRTNDASLAASLGDTHPQVPRVYAELGGYSLPLTSGCNGLILAI